MIPLKLSLILQQAHQNSDGVEAVVNAFDTYALKMAKRYIEDNGGNVNSRYNR